jgi:dGTPase
MVVDLATEISKRLMDDQIRSIADVRHCRNRLVSFSENQDRLKNQIKDLLNTNMYKHPRLVEMKKVSTEILTFLFNHYLTHWDAIPEDFRLKYPDQDGRRMTVDYIAGMTDRFALGEFRRLQ